MMEFSFKVGDLVRFNGIGKGVVQQQVRYWGGLHYAVKFACGDVPHICHQSELSPVMVTMQRAATRGTWAKKVTT